MAIIIVDDDPDMLKAMEGQIKNAAVGQDVTAKCYTAETRNEIENLLRDNVQKTDFLFIDLFLLGNKERSLPFRSFESVKIIKSTKVMRSHIMIYSNANHRPVEELLDQVGECHYMPILWTAFSDKNKERYKKMEKMRNEFLKEISQFLDEGGGGA